MTTIMSDSGTTGPLPSHAALGEHLSLQALKIVLHSKEPAQDGLGDTPIRNFDELGVAVGYSSLDQAIHDLRPWNEGRVLGAKRALQPHEFWAIRFWLYQHRRLRDRALFDFAIDSKLRGCDVVKVRICDIVAGGRTEDCAVVVQQKTKRPVQFVLVEPARKTLLASLERRVGTLNDFVFPSQNDYVGT